MKLLIKAILLTIFIQQVAFAQKAPVKFGDVSLDEVKMTTYPKDSSASAVVLKDFGETKFVYDNNRGFILNFERTTRIKILKSDGLKWGDFSIPLYHNKDLKEKLVGLKAITYNLENGKVVESKLKDNGIFREEYSSNVEMTKVTLPNVKVGSVIEIAYEVASGFLFNLQSWEFQSTIPVILSEYWVTIPEYYSYERYMQGYVGLAVSENKEVRNSITTTSTERSGGTFGAAVKSTTSSSTTNYNETKFRWVAQEVPAFKPEPYILSAESYISKIDFELASIKYPNQPIEPIMGSWEDVNKTYYEESDFGGELKANDFLKKPVSEIVLNKTTSEEKIAAITYYVKDNFRWNGVSRKFTETPLRKVFEEKKGSSAELNLLLASMLEKAGIEVYPVLISTRDNGFIRETTPVSSQFNYTICVAKVDGKNILLDATDKFLPVGTLPERCLNGNGFVVSQNGYSWVPLTSPGKSKIIVTADLKLDLAGSLNGTLKIDRSGYKGYSSRKNYSAKGETDYLKDFLGTRSWQVEHSLFENAKSVTETFKETHQLKVNDHITTAGSLFYINPLILFRETENPFKLEKREYPVDYGSPFDVVYLGKLLIPDSYAVDELPQTKLIVLPGNAGRFTYNISQIGNVINVVSNFQINKSLFVQDEYPNLKEFYNQVVAKQSEQIVLKKK